MDRASALERMPPLVATLLSSPIGALVRAVARVRASVHVKLLAAFLLITLLFIAMGVVSFRTVAGTSRQTDLLDQAHERVGWSRQIEHALAMQMHFTAMALLSQDEHTVGRILRENNRFNDTLARLETAARAEERALIRDIRAAQEDAMAVVADIANATTNGGSGQSGSGSGGGRKNGTRDGGGSGECANGGGDHHRENGRGPCPGENGFDEPGPQHQQQPKIEYRGPAPPQQTDRDCAQCDGRWHEKIVNRSRLHGVEHDARQDVGPCGDQPRQRTYEGHHGGRAR